MPYLGVKPADEFTSKDLNGEELILDADADTTITADTDDTIDIRIAGADDFQFTANTMSVLSGSTLNIDSGATIANSGTATGFGLTGVTTGSGNVTITSGNLIVASGNGIDFSATADSGATMTSELLDDYEEGTFTPTAAGNFSGSVSNVEGYYVKVGSVVAIWMVATFSNTSDGSMAALDGLPFTSTTYVQQHHALTQGYTTSAYTGPLYPQVNSGNAEMFWYTEGSSHGTGVAPSYSDIGCGTSAIIMSVGGTYRTNS